MKKIDITITEIAVPEHTPYMDFAVTEDPWLNQKNAMEGADIPQAFANFKKVRYERRWIYHPNGTKTEYLVKVDDKHIFQDLVQISNDDLQTFLFKETKAIREQWKNDLFEQKWKIKMMPWWKRLFNKF